MARETQSSPASEKKLEQYGVWVKVKPREVVPAPALEESFELSDLEPPRGAAAPQRPETDESSLTAEEEKLLDELETELGPEEGSADVLVPDEEPLLEEEGELPDMDSLTREAEVTLSEGTPADDHFDDLEALESELASVASSARPAAATSSEILARIEEELRSIRVDLTQLRGELSGLRTRANQPAAETPASGAETQSGFFDEDEDETIALTGDELDNILNTSDIVLVVSISLAILFFGDKTSRFTRFDLGCFGAVAAILIFWLFTRQHAAAHLAIQTILVIAYFPVVKRIWKADRNTEPFAAWIGMLLAAALSLLSSKGWLATVYAVRAVACTSLLLAFMTRAKWREQRASSLASRE